MIRYIIILYLFTAFTAAADVDLKNLNDAKEENQALKESGIRWGESDRSAIRKKIKKARGEYNSIFDSVPMASTLSKIKKLIEKLTEVSRRVEKET